MFFITAFSLNPFKDVILDQLENVLNHSTGYSQEEILDKIYELEGKHGIKINENLDEQLEFVVSLFDKEGRDHANETLYFSKGKLDELIEKRIREGINNFFSALMLSYQSEKV